MSKAKKIDVYQLLLWDKNIIPHDSRVWLSLFNLEEGQDKMRRKLFKEIGELKKENTELKEVIQEIRASLNIENLQHKMAVAT